MNDKKMNDYAYLGEVSVEEFKEITSAFPCIVGIGVDSDNDIVVGVPKNLGYDAVGMYQLIVLLWGDKKLIREVWSKVLYS